MRRLRCSSLGDARRMRFNAEWVAPRVYAVKLLAFAANDQIVLLRMNNKAGSIFGTIKSTVQYFETSDDGAKALQMYFRVEVK